MDENRKQISINLSTLILIIAAVVFLVMSIVYIIVILFTPPSEEEKDEIKLPSMTIDQNTAEVNEDYQEFLNQLGNLINDGMAKDNVAKEDDSTNVTRNTVEDIDFENYTYTNTITNQAVADKRQKEAETVITKYVEEYVFYEDNNVGTFGQILSDLGIVTEDYINNLYEDNISTPADQVVKTEAKYEDFKAKMLEMVTQNYFNEYFSNYQNIGGYVGIDMGAGEYVPYAFISIDQCLSYDDNTNLYIYEVTLCDGESYLQYENEEIDLEDCLFQIEVVLREVNGKMVIDDMR